MLDKDNIYSVKYNWRDGRVGIGPAEVESATVQHNGVDLITYHEPQGDGDRHYCDIYYNSGLTVRVFNINKIVFRE